MITNNTQRATMKQLMNRTFFGLAVAFGFTVGASAQSYSIDWFKIAGGGGTSTGGVYSVSGTVGQPDAGKMSGGNYTMDGGFWSLVSVVQTPGAPLLAISRLGSDVRLAWPSPSTGFVLQENSVIGTTNWLDVAQLPADDGTNKSVTISSPIGNRFYRLKSP